MVKITVCYFTSKILGFSSEESRFVSGLWAGKASCQAALCTVALELVHSSGNKKDEEYAMIVFMSMICAILIGVPFASSWVSVYGNRPLGLCSKR